MLMMQLAIVRSVLSGGVGGGLLLLGQMAIAVPSSPLLATSCLPGGADAPRSQGVVIEREQIAEQARVQRDLDGILTSEVPGFFRNRYTGSFLRGRRVRILVDGVPLGTDDTVLSTLSPDRVERIEVIPGSSPLC